MAERVHEVWFNPGWENEVRSYRGPDPTTAALSFAAATERVSGHDEVVWTVDGATHQLYQDGRVTHGVPQTPG